MSDLYTIVLPQVAMASFAVNPVDMNTQTLLSVTVVEETVYLKPTYYYSGELFSGEV